MRLNKTFLYLQIGAKEDIINSYNNVTMTVEALAKKYNVTPRTIQRFVRTHGGKIRTVAEANKVTVKLKDYSRHKVPDHLKAKRIILPKSVRYELIKSHPFCKMCGDRPSLTSTTILEIDHIDGNAQNNNKCNLQVLCRECNRGKR